MRVGKMRPAGAQKLSIKEIGSFFVGGENVTLQGLPVEEIVFAPGVPPIKTDPNGEFEFGQTYTQFIKLSAPSKKYPILFWHGGGMTGTTWETTPDGRPGWVMFFLRKGYDVYVSDSAERGRASWARYPEIYPSNPVFRSKKEAWELFRIGPPGSYAANPSERKAYEDTQFPVEYFDHFADQMVPRWIGSNAMLQRAYDLLVQRVGPCIVIGHSQGAMFAQQAALRAPEKIKAVVSMDSPPGLDPDKASAAPVRTVPHLFVWSDHQEGDPFWTPFQPSQKRWRDAIAAEKGTADWMVLSSIGLKGNSYLMMMDRNSDAVAEVISQWLDRQPSLR